MKRIITYLSILVAAAACSPLDIEFQHEEQAFETRADRILIEAILPQATAATDEVYIIGAFNGGDAAIGNASYKLTRSENITAKWGIYLNPSDFQGGKTLADGFTFYNKKQGYERSATNEAVSHKLTIGVGEWANVYADKWEAYFNPEMGGDEEGEKLPEHDGIRVYIQDQTGWDAIALYMWGDVNNFGGDWPGSQVAGTVTLGGKEWKYFEYGDDIIGLGENLIFNNNGEGTQLADYNVTFAEGVKDYFFTVTADGVSEAPNPVEGGLVIPAHDGIRVWANDQTGWDEIALYMWGDVNNFGGDWPGMQVGGTETIGGVEFKYFEYGDDIIGLAENLIFNNNGNGTQLADVNVAFAEGVKDYFFLVTTDGATLLDGPGGSAPSTPKEEEDGPRIYIKNSTSWGTKLYAHYWGNSATEWPGKELERTSVVMAGEEYPVTFWATATLHGNRGTSVEIILHPNDEEDQSKRVTATILLDTDRYYELTETGLQEIDMGVHLFVDNKTYWPGELFVHVWDDSNSTEWPGVTAVPGYDEEQNAYSCFFIPKEFRGKQAEVMFHSDVDDANNRFQTSLNFEKDLFYTLSREISLDPVTKDPVTLYVIDQTGWDEIALYMWGDVNNLGGGWPGIQVSRTEQVGKTTIKVFQVPDALGRNENLIFNNNGNNVQLPDFNLTFTQAEYYLLVTAEGVEITERPAAAAPKTTFFVDDQTGWDAMALYMWGDVNNLGGGWPGAPVCCTLAIGGTDYKVIVVEDGVGLNENLIFNNNGNNVQLPDFNLTLNEAQYFLTVTAEGVTVNEAPATVAIFVDDQTGWDAMALYQWGAVNNLGGGWPGAQVSATATVLGKDCKVFVVDEAKGLNQNLIFNNNGNGTQLPDYNLTFDKNAYYFTVTAEGVDEF